MAFFKFFEELNDFLPKEKKKIFFPYFFKGNPSVKDSIEANHVPHTEVGLILANGSPVNFSYHLTDYSKIEVFPLRPSLLYDCLLRPPPPETFIADVHLGKLVRYLRLLGFDTYYNNSLEDKEIIRIALEENRILLTRDRRILYQKRVIHGCCPRSDNPLEQLKEILLRYDLKKKAKPFTRCLCCNGLLDYVEKEKIIELLEPKTRIYYNTFKRCSLCKKIFWQGSHPERLKKIMEISGIL
ncbi:MAG: Mut7-C ubiquitin/RNAse domain-containing protein [Chitinispirillaceae bacterium]|nr:Mut7-C ubiquitin/RNAse domain-containing protein [Chitinispirillaceae bacterium]